MCAPLLAAVPWLASLFGGAGAAAAGGTAAAAGTAAAGTAAAAAAGTAAAGAAAAGTAAATLTSAQILSLAAAAVSAGTAVAGSLQAASMAKATGKVNQRIADAVAADTIHKGNKDAQEVARRAALLKADQRSTMAARGLDLTTGTPSDILDQTDFFGEIDAEQTRYNARKDAWSVENQGRNVAATAAANTAAARGKAAGTLLSSGGVIADRWYQFSTSAG